MLSASDEANLFSSLRVAEESYAGAGMARESALVRRAGEALRLHLRQREAALADASAGERLARARDALARLDLLHVAAVSTLREVLALASTADGWAHVQPAARELLRYLEAVGEVRESLCSSKQGGCRGSGSPGAVVDDGVGTAAGTAVVRCSKCCYEVDLVVTWEVGEESAPLPDHVVKSAE